MKLMLRTILVIALTAFCLDAAYAQAPREQLKQMVEQLQGSPNDEALREKIIALAHELKPAPAIPEEAERHMAYGTAAFKGAKSVADYKDAVKEFEQATLAAPWWGDAYYNLGVVQDKAEQYDAALTSLKLAQLASPGSKDIKDLMYQVEYRSKKANDPVAQQQKKIGQAQLEFAALIQKLDGAVFTAEISYKGVVAQEEIRFHKGGDNNFLKCLTRFKTVQSSDATTPVTGQWEDGTDMYVWPTSDSEFDSCTVLGHYRLAPNSRTLYGFGPLGQLNDTWHRQ